MEKAQFDHAVKKLCRRCGSDETSSDAFLQEISLDEEIRQELAYYLEKGTFACQARVAGYTVVDIMVWQMDHFKARLDRDNTDTRQNPEKMLLMAFQTFLEMKKDPEKYIRKMRYETGTDYPDKY